MDAQVLVQRVFLELGVSVAFDPRSVGTQIDDSLWEKVYQQELF
jgi:hypothetical protein